MIGDDGCCGVVIEEASVCISALQVSELSKLILIFFFVCKYNSNLYLAIFSFISTIAIHTCQSLIPLHILICNGMIVVLILFHLDKEREIEGFLWRFYSIMAKGADIVFVGFGFGF